MLMRWIYKVRLNLYVCDKIFIKMRVVVYVNCQHSPYISLKSDARTNSTELCKSHRNNITFDSQFSVCVVVGNLLGMKWHFGIPTYLILMFK